MIVRIDTGPMTIRTKFIFTLIVGLTFAGSVSSYQLPGPFGAASEIHRDRLEQRLSVFVSHHRARDWSQVHAMLSVQYKGSLGVDASLERFVEGRRFSRLRRFTPSQSIQLSGAPDPPLVLVIGCGEFERLGPNLNEESSVECTWEDDDWYFSEIRSQAPCLDCQPRSCKH